MIAPVAYLDTGFPPSRRDGSPAGEPALVLVHGDFSAGAYTWSRQIRALMESCRVVAVDRAGHGRSRRLPGPYTFAGDARDLLATLDALAIRRAHFAGHSYGALVVIEAARVRPESVCSLHLVEPPYLSLLSEDPDVARLMAESGRARRLGGPPEAVAAAFFRAVIGEVGASELMKHKAWQALVIDADRLVQEEFAGDYPAAAIRDVPRVPTFVYSGGKSHPGLVRVARRVAELLGAGLDTFPEAGHDVPKSARAFTETLGRRVAPFPAQA